MSSNNCIIYLIYVVLVKTIEDYITYYNTKRIQRRLKLMTPLEYHEHFGLAA